MKGGVPGGGLERKVVRKGMLRALPKTGPGFRLPEGEMIREGARTGRC